VTDGLELRDVSLRRGRVSVLERESVVVPRGGTLVVTGANGMGKSSFLHLAGGLVAPDRGEVRIAGHPAQPARPEALVDVGVRRGFVFQQGGLVANLSALENVALPLRYHADRLGLRESMVESRARFCLGAVGVEGPNLHALPGRLSFGIAKRVAFARAVAIEPNFAFFDDPDGGLDHENAEVVHDILVSFRDDPSVTMIVATNHRGLIERLALPVHELAGGRLHRADLSTTPPRSLI
jgi:ABC-type transporter Mla maintaining outer membrane lipid asymmetry ATPase subunit MlaF